MTIGESLWISQLSHWHIRQTSIDAADRDESHLSVITGFGESAWRVSYKNIDHHCKEMNKQHTNLCRVSCFL